MGTIVGQVGQVGNLRKTNIVIRETVDKQLEWDKNKSNCSNKRIKFILNMFYKTKISLNLQGMVLFDPLVLANFVHSEGIKSTNLLDFFIQNTKVGNKAINEGILLPIYTIEIWDYEIIVNLEEESKIDPKWKLFITPYSFPFRVESENVIISDIYAIMNWKPDYYLNFPSKDERIGVDDSFIIPKGNYSVDILGFRNNLNPEECGYEFFFKKVSLLPFIENLNIDNINFKVDGTSDDSW